MLNKYLDVREDVLVAISNGEAVVALESTIISHGMPYPQNVETALQCEKFISAVLSRKTEVGRRSS